MNIKKILIILLLGIIITNVKADDYKIPDDAIRLRVVANSNSSYDQSIKMDVKNLLEIKMYDLLKDIKGSNNAKEVISNNLINVENNIKELLENKNYDKSFKINFGKNYLPKTEYRNVVYEEGYYDSLLVTLGEGKGDNWWCVLFPPLCLLEAKENDKVEYKFFIEELFDKYF